MDVGALRRFLHKAAAGLLPSGSSATLLLVGDAMMQGLNSKFRGRDYPTDVLSFPVGGDQDYLGDIVISVETARRQALRRGSSLPRELRVLGLHGLLHLLGHDHETDDGQMRRIEYRLRRKLGITRPRVRRA